MTRMQLDFSGLGMATGAAPADTAGAADATDATDAAGASHPTPARHDGNGPDEPQSPPRKRLRPGALADLPAAAGRGTGAAAGSAAGSLEVGALGVGSGSAIGPGSPSTPRAAKGMPTETDVRLFDQNGFLDRIGKPALAKLAAWTNQHAGGRWAFTGSVALNMHSLALEGQIVRPCADADIQLAHHACAVFLNYADDASASTACLPRSKPNGDPTQRIFEDMPVDVVSAGEHGSLVRSDSILIGNVPVLTLAALKTLKEAQLVSQCGEHRRKAEQDLPTIMRLLALAPPTAPVATGQGVGPAQPWPEFRT